MWPKLSAATALLLLQGTVADDCPYTVSVLDVSGVQCVSSAPCSGTYYASGLSQGVGACPTGTSCALLPETPIMGCAAEGRTDLVYVNADGSLTKDGKSVTLSGASSSTSDSTTAPSSSSSSTSSKSSSSASSKSSSSASSKSSSSASSKSSSSASSKSSSSSSGSNASSGSGSTTSGSDGGSDASKATVESSNSTATSASSASNSSSSNSTSESSSGSYTISPGSSSANQQAEFNPGSILSDGSDASNTSSDSGLGLSSIIGIVVGCLAVVAIAAGARLLKKGKETELATPEGALEGYNNGGGGSGMTPKENVLLL